MSKSSEWAASSENESAEVDESTLDSDRNDDPTPEEWQEIVEGLSELVNG